MNTPFFSQPLKKRRGILKIAGFLCLFVLINVAATKYTAANLGLPDTFSPFRWLVWTQIHWLKYPVFFGKVLLFWVIANALSVGVFLSATGIGRKTKGVKGLQGTAHLADINEIKKAGLINENPGGVYLGRYADRRHQYYLTDESNAHVLGCAPTRGGKGVAWVIPTLLAWKGSLICLDVKGENHQLTAEHRKQSGQKILAFNPSSPENEIKFNPLSEIRISTSREVGDAQIVAEMVMNPDGKGLDDHWKKSGFSFLTGAILFALGKNEKASLADLARLLADPEKEFEDLLNEMKEDGSFVAACASEMLNKASRERSSVLSSVLASLSLYRDPIISRNIAESDFRVSDLMNSGTPVSLYLILNPKDKGRMTPLIRIILTLVIKLSLKDLEFKDGEPAPAYRHRMLLLLDEFPSLGHLPVFEESLAYFAGYGIKAFIIIQNLEQLYAHYTKNESITGNCHVKAFFTPDNLRTAKCLSEMAGHTTIIKETKKVQGDRFGAVLSKSFIGKEEVKRPLFLPDECLRLPGPKKNNAGMIEKPGACMIFVAGHPVILCEQSLFFKEDVFLKRSKAAFRENFLGENAR